MNTLAKTNKPELSFTSEQTQLIKNIKEVAGWFACSNGKIYSQKAGRFLEGRVLKSGYVQVGTQKHSGVKFYRAHILICKAFHGEPHEKNITVNHINFDRQDNRPENLEWTTLQSNIKKSVLANRRLRKLTPDLIRNIKKEYTPWDRKNSGSVIAKKYGIHKSYVYALFNNINCAHIV